MNAGTKVGGFVALLVVVGLAGAGIGSLAGPIDTGSPGHDGAEHTDDTGSEPGHDEGHDPGAATEPGSTEDPHAGHDAVPDDDGTADEGSAAAPGTSPTQDGYRLALDPEVDGEIRFQVLDPDGAPVVDTEIVHEKALHLIMVGISEPDYAHLHPEVDGAGTWSVAVPDVAPGPYRVVADLTPSGGPALVLGDDLTVPGERTSRGGVLAEGNPTTVDAITVTFDGHPEVGDTDLAFTATRDGEVIEPEPYLGARGHLVAFRAGDLAYAHVHPHSDDASSAVRFTATFPTANRYALYLDLQVDGVVHTFPFVVEVHGHDR